MKKTNWIKFIIVNILTLPLRLLCILLGLIFLVFVRAYNYSIIMDKFIERQEKAKRKRK